MNHLLAKTKGKNSVFLKVISDKEIFELPSDLDNPKEFDSDYKLEDDEWFAIYNFSKQEYCIDLLRENLISSEYDRITKTNYSNIEYLCSCQSGIFYFQKIGTRQFIRKKFLSLNNLSINENEPIIVINDYADAIYIKDVDKLYFKRLSPLSKIFKGIDTLYKEATREDTEHFLQSDFIQLGKNYNVNKVKKANRKRIAKAIETISNLDKKEKKEIFTYIKKYRNDLEFDTNNSTFKIESENDLKNLLYGIDERYYTTISTKEKRIANSISTIK